MQQPLGGGQVGLCRGVGPMSSALPALVLPPSSEPPSCPPVPGLSSQDRPLSGCWGSKAAVEGTLIPGGCAGAWGGWRLVLGDGILYWASPSFCFLSPGNVTFLHSCGAGHHRSSVVVALVEGVDSRQLPRTAPLPELGNRG